MPLMWLLSHAGYLNKLMSIVLIKEKKKKEEDKRHQRYSHGPSKLNDENILARNLPSEMELKSNLAACRGDWL